MPIHPTAVVHPGARIDPSTVIGPCAVVDEHVEIGAGCTIGPGVYLTGHTQIGAENRFHAGCVMGDEPQDIKYHGAPTGLIIGCRNRFREHTTVHRSRDPEEPTRIGSDGFFMAHCHVGHNCQIGNGVVIANGALLAGHVQVADRAFISGNCLVHQFVRIGTLALMQGGSGIGKDLPPYTIALGKNRICGLNIVGLRRAGLTAEQRLEIKRLYHAVFRNPVGVRRAAEGARIEFTSELAVIFLDFILQSKRGVCVDRASRSQGEEQGFE